MFVCLKVCMKRTLASRTTNCASYKDGGSPIIYTFSFFFLVNMIKLCIINFEHGYSKQNFYLLFA